MTARYDPGDDNVVIVIGSGAGGGTLAAALAAQGVSVVCLEAGGEVDIVQDPPEMFRRLRWPDVRVAEGDLDPVLPVYVSQAVGGTTNQWGGVSLRYQPHDFKARSTYGAIAGTTLADWSISYDDLSPYYERAEQRLGVTGLRAEAGLPDHNNLLVLKAGARRRGYREVSNGHLAINVTPRDGRPACLQMGFCASGCTIGAKWSTRHAELPRALATGNCELRSHAMAVQIEHDAANRATAVVYIDAQGKWQRQRARAVCVAGNGIETPRLLLLSASARFPHGLANSSLQVGRNYMTDLLGRAAAVMPGRVDSFKGTTYAGLVADGRRHDPARGALGSYVFVSRGLHLSVFPNEPRPDGWGAAYARVIESYRNVASAAVLAQDLPVADNRITLDDTARDRHNLPAPRIRKIYHENDRLLMAHALAELRGLYEALGARQVFTRQEFTALHNLGTCRQSVDPENGVCNEYGQTHDLPNLFVSDGSQFVSTGAAPPTLTIVALALRQADHLVQRLHSGTL